MENVEVQEEKKSKKQVEPKRVYSSNMTIDSDLFKLEIANMQKNIGHDDKKPVLIGVEHCHFYRTFDSNGKEMDKCSYVGGHTHAVKVIVDKSGNLSGECGNAIGALPGDTHSHAVRYLKSDKVERRRHNTQAAIDIGRLSEIPKA